MADFVAYIDAVQQTQDEYGRCEPLRTIVLSSKGVRRVTVNQNSLKDFSPLPVDSISGWALPKTV